MAKKVDEEELTDIFYVNCFINYDTGLAKIPTEWLVNNIIDGKIEIEYGLGFLPGWNHHRIYGLYIQKSRIV